MRKLAALVLVTLTSCRCAEVMTEDAGTDAGMQQMQVDSGTPDAGTPDSGAPDSGTPDAGTPDAGTPDAGIPDAGPLCALSLDASVPTQLFFLADDGLIGAELWMTDGTPAGTVSAFDLNLGPSGANISRPVRFGPALLFRADDQAHGSELWRSDGTLAGTQLVKDINPGTSGSSLSNLVVAGCLVFFAANDGANGNELWVTDGTDQGTRLLKDIRVGGDGNPNYLAAIGDKVLFRANDGTTGDELWVSDGTPAGTVLLADLTPGAQGSAPDGLKTLEGRVWFTAGPPYVSDGTLGGTHVVGRATLDGGFPGGSGFTSYAGHIYLSANDGDAGYELWRTDLAGETASLVADVRLGSVGSSPSRLTVSNGALYFTADDGLGGGAEPWVFAADAGTLLSLGDLRPGTAGSQAGNFLALGDATFFMANGPEGYELWRTDGTSAALFQDIQPGAGGSFPSPIAYHRGALYFSANDGTNGAELWKLEADAGAAFLLKDINTTSSNASSSPGGFFSF